MAEENRRLKKENAELKRVNVWRAACGKSSTKDSGRPGPRLSHLVPAGCAGGDG